MTERKPLGTSWESWIEAQIRVAQEQGAFDNLPGAGKPLPNIDQVTTHSGGSSSSPSASSSPCCRPRSSCCARWSGSSPRWRSPLTRRPCVAASPPSTSRSPRLNATVTEGPPTRLGPLDIDQVVARWRRTRSATPQ